MLFWGEIDCRVAVLILGKLGLIKLHNGFVLIADEIIRQYSIYRGIGASFLPVVALNILNPKVSSLTFRVFYLVNHYANRRYLFLCLIKYIHQTSHPI